ncbi:MAG: response regulator [Deltaproteobacteria bacterium]|nr:MAG: response regulator [Deltaproteobacteria bacterium]
MMEQLLPGFVDECKEIVERVTDHLIELEKAHERLRFDDLARGLHTLKGSAATLGLAELSELAHRMEDAVLPLRGKTTALPGALTDALLKTLDTWMAHLRATTAKSELPDLKPSHKLLEAVRHAVQAVEPGKPAANNGKAGAEKRKPSAAAEKEKEKEKKSSKREREAPVARAEPAPAEPAAEEDAGAAEEAGSWRVRTREVVSLLHEVERLREVRLRLEERRRELERGISQLARLGILAQTAEVRALLMGVQRALSADGDEAGDIVASMEDELKAICTLPVRTVLEPLRRSVRDLCKQSGKLARLSIVGGEVSLDRRVLESLRGPLVHLVRNAVDHGLEVPDVREARGKHREGIVVVRVEQQGNMLFIEVSDDGNGLDLALIKQAARELSIVPGVELDAMAPAQLHQLIFRNGFSTRRTVTEVSGRGVGMDVVRSQIQALQGHIEVQSTPGQGTRFTLTLPAELGSSPVLVVRCGEHELGIPMPAVETSLLARSGELRVARTRVQLSHRDHLIPVQDLGTLLALRQPEVPHDGQPLLVLQSQGRRIALAVDEVIGDRELVIRPLPPEVRDLAAYQGAATLARGELVLIVRSDWLTGVERREANLTGTRRALVVDDSLTARALHRTALESAGWSVHTASSGRQALEQLRHSAYDVMVSDIGMDEMDGYQLTVQARARPELEAMPIILVSARDSESDQQRGAASGADGFLSKKDCAAGRLIAEVQTVIARRKGAA